METRTVKPTSTRSAVTEDIILRETQTTRLAFRPVLVDNEQQKSAAVRGTFTFQRRKAAAQWIDTETEPLSSLKQGEQYKLELRSAEVLKLYTELGALYNLYDTAGIPRAETRFIRASRTAQTVVNMTDEDLQTVIEGSHTLGTKVLARLLRWAGSARNLSSMLEQLEPLDKDALGTLNVAVGLANLKRALKVWIDHRVDPNEEFWQQLLASQTFVLEQLFAVPIVIIQSKAYVGGKSITNRGGHMVDFLVKNRVTKSAGLVEIKTPMTPLLGRQYRTGVYNVSEELSGAVLQVLTYRDSLTRERSSLINSQADDLDVFDPKCLVLVGHAARELTDTAKRRAFELYRSQLPDVEIVTYDEMFRRTKRLIEMLEGQLTPPASE